MEAFPAPVPGASLLLSFKPVKKNVLIIGGNNIAAKRAFAALEAEANVLVLVRGGLDAACEELRWRANQGQLALFDLDSLPCSSAGPSDHWRDAKAVDSFIYRQPDKMRLVCITDTVSSPHAAYRRTYESAREIARECRHRSIPVNVTDMPDLCDFTFMSTQRFVDAETGTSTPLQVGITTNGHGCRLAGRIRRDIVASLPKEIGASVTKVGRLRELAQVAMPEDAVEIPGLNEDGAPVTPNEPVPQRKQEETAAERARRRMKWVAQVSEYWSIRRLAHLTDAQMDAILDGREGLISTSSSVRDTDSPTPSVGDSDISTSQHDLDLAPSRRGRILLVGSGPGHPSLLTVATHAALTKHADLVLSDKLVPEAVLALVPPGVEVRIARKFPGNAEGAQMELMEAAIEAANRGLTVVRLKQGDPTVYGRAGEEVIYFRARGFEPVVVPGVSSVLAGPTFAGIPVTQRGAAESFIVCTGVGRQGKEVKLPGYERGRTLVILMGVARLPQVLDTLQTGDAESTGRRDGPAYPSHTPIALIERASMPDQRVICSTLKDISAALESVGEQRPPGMLVIGWSVLSLWKKGDMTILEDGAETHDAERVKGWLGEKLWRVSEGLNAEWEGW
ncbi:uroporphyrin-III C-methyltransferase [Trametes versicolor FP-101664 SS1]|uniref:uroporphyrin-III C-methyltransferase n=1 Tax=Trametes versicolor (strain FP-101664) TaxID=717944 RepID=UPI0004622EF5|nr:uroporphyrin-III C-methyltransferase [Trametes versicolor FP-101664 SS1]EIW64470.1 uroporphyrin-III C-methyltransferase [Trametes versicolor FP-101664 SS1]